MSVLSPLLYIQRLTRVWWIVVVCTLVGGLIGFTVSRLKKPIFEAKAIFHVSINLDAVPVKQQPLELADEDIALASLWAAFGNPDVVNYLIQQAGEKNIHLDWNIIARKYTVERKNTIWELRYRDNDPQVAYTVINLWATKSYEKALEQQAESKIPAYVIFTPPLIPGPPDRPVYYDLVKLLLAGGVIGFLVGILCAEKAALRLREL